MNGWLGPVTLRLDSTRSDPAPSRAARSQSVIPRALEPSRATPTPAPSRPATEGAADYGLVIRSSPSSHWAARVRRCASTCTRKKKDWSGYPRVYSYVPALQGPPGVRGQQRMDPSLLLLSNLLPLPLPRGLDCALIHGGRVGWVDGPSTGQPAPRVLFSFCSEPQTQGRQPEEPSSPGLNLWASYS